MAHRRGWVNFPDFFIGIIGEKVCGMNQSRGIGTIGVKGHHHIQSQESEVCQILSRQRLTLQVSMNETEASQPEDSRSILGEVRDRNPFLISYNDEFDGPSPTHQNANLASNFIR
jgi:hypothetical protein